MKCCGCSKEIDVSKVEVINSEPQWYGKFTVSTCVKVICNICIKDTKKREIYIER